MSSWFGCLLENSGVFAVALCKKVIQSLLFCFVNSRRWIGCGGLGLNSLTWFWDLGDWSSPEIWFCIWLIGKYPFFWSPLIWFKPCIPMFVFDISFTCFAPTISSTIFLLFPFIIRILSK